MSHRHADEDTQIPSAQNTDSGTRRQYAHLNLNPTHVIDQIKTKVKRKCSSNKMLSDTLAVTVDDSYNENNDTSARLSEKQNQLKLPTASLPKAHSQPNIASEMLGADDSNAYHGSKSKDENNASTENILAATEKFDKEDQNHFLIVPQDKPQASSDPETNKKRSKSKSKSSKESKAPSELASQSDIKKQRQKARHTVQSASKKRKSKGTKEDELDTMQMLPYLAGFQIRDDDFNSIFDDVPADEQLIVSYPCIWRKDMFTHGRIFLSVNYVCFYTCFAKWEERVCIALKDIASIKREKSVKVLSNAIRLRTKIGDEYVFASFTSRERIFLAICRLWHNALLENPLGYLPMRTAILADQSSGEGSSVDSEASPRLVNSVKQTSEHPESQSVSPLTSNSSVPVFAFSDATEPAAYRSSCSCESHLARVCAERTLPYHVDKLYELIFDDNAFSRAYHDSQKLTDFNLGEWRVHSETGKRVRQVTYKTVTQSILGTNTITCTEKQTMEAEEPHSMYVISTEVYNEGVKYTDSFFVATKYCMFQRDAKHCGLRITAEIKYIKSVNSFIRTFIEKNCHASIDEGLGNLVRRLESQQPTRSHRQAHQKPPATVSKQHTQEKKDESATLTEPKIESPSENTVAPQNQVLAEEKPVARNGTLINIALFIGVFLLLLHVYLCYKLYSIDQLLQNSNAGCLNRCRKGCGGGGNKAHS